MTVGESLRLGKRMRQSQADMYVVQGNERVLCVTELMTSVLIVPHE